MKPNMSGIFFFYRILIPNECNLLFFLEMKFGPVSCWLDFEINFLCRTFASVFFFSGLLMNGELFLGSVIFWGRKVGCRGTNWSRVAGVVSKEARKK